MKSRLIFTLLLSAHWACAQKKDAQEIPYTSFRDKLVLYADMGFSSSPFSMKFESANTNIHKLRYRNNIGLVMGLGASYKWFALRLGFTVLGNLKPIAKHGKTSYFGIGFDFPIKKTYFEFDFRNYQGYAIKNAWQWDDALTPLAPNYIRPETNTLSISLNGWYFNNRDFKMSVLKGKVGHYNKQVFTWYLKGTFNIQGISNNESIIPLALTDSLNTKTRTSTLSALDFGVIPGAAYVNRYKNWQYAAMVGFGPVVQSKFYIVDQETRGFLGLAPRYDIRFIAGYNVPKWFVMVITNFDNKSIRINDLRYLNSAHTIRVVGGIRLDTKKKKAGGDKDKPERKRRFFKS